MKSILQIAEETVAERRQSYGPPDEHWARTIGMINAAFGTSFVTEDWPIIISLDKIAREMGPGPVRDNPIDVCGYLHGRDEILQARAQDGSHEQAIRRPEDGLIEYLHCGYRGAHGAHRWDIQGHHGRVALFDCLGGEPSPL